MPEPNLHYRAATNKYMEEVQAWKQTTAACQDEHTDETTRISLLEKGLLAFSQLLPRQEHVLYSASTKRMSLSLSILKSNSRIYC